MDLDRLTLSPHQVAQWYATSLVVVPGAPPRARRPEREGAPASSSTAAAAPGAATPATASPAATPATKPVAAPPAPLKYLGENQQHILILVRDANAVFLEEKAFQFLLSVLEACKLSMASVALVNLASEPRLPGAIADQLGSTQVILFGVGIEELGLPMLFPPYQVQPHGSRTYLAADPLAEISAERTLKGRLWACLKTLFQR